MINDNKLSLLLFALIISALHAFAQPAKQQWYELRTYQVKTGAQEAALEKYLKDAYLPALHRNGIASVGVFRPIDRDTANLRVIVLLPFESLSQFEKLESALLKDKKYVTDGKDYIDVAHTSPSYIRIESVLLKAFTFHPRLELPQLRGPRIERIYELRSYESASEKIFRNKVHMFNEGGEIVIFTRLSFNAVFYGEVFIGDRMPNLMYLTTFENKTARDQHWSAFGNDPAWKQLSSNPMYKDNVSHIDITFLRPTDYSDY